MMGEHRDPARELEDQMRAADDIIESLEAEVADLRQDLERASAALRASREEVSARGTALEDLQESERLRAAAEEESRVLHEQLTRLREESADEQLKLRNQHIESIAALRKSLEEQRRADVEGATSEGKISDLREEYRKERSAAEERHKAEVEEFKRAAKGWEEKLRVGYRDLEERHKAEVEKLRAENRDIGERHAAEVERLKAETHDIGERHKTEVEKLRAQYRDIEERHEAEVERLEAEARDLGERHKAEVEELRRGHAQEVQALQKSYGEEIDDLAREHHEVMDAALGEAERRTVELEKALREEFEREREEERREAGEQHQAELAALRSDAASREFQIQSRLGSEIENRREEIRALNIELESSQAAAEERREADIKEIKNLAAIREGELRRTQATRLSEEKEVAERRASTLKAQREADLKSLRERHARETAKLQRTFEERLAAEVERREREVSDLEERAEGLKMRQESEALLYVERLSQLEHDKIFHHKAVDEELERRLAGHAGEKAAMEDRISELQDGLEESGALAAELREALEESRNGAVEVHGKSKEPQPATEDLKKRLEQSDAARLLAEERVANLESRLAEAREEGRRRARELEEALDDLRTASDPERRLRAGIELFNTSEHTRTVASISKALGLPKVHVGADALAGKPVVTLVWGDISWRRYVCDPTEGVEEPRVYLVGTGDDPSGLPSHAPNARMNARGHLILGVQAY